MLAAVYYPENGIQIEEVPTPVINPGEILLKVRACGICGTDVLKINRQLPKKPVVLGHELVGEIVETCGDIKNFKKGDRMVVAHHVPCGACHYCQHQSHSMCRSFKSSNLDPGGFAQLIRVPSEHIHNTAFLVPEHLSDEEALFTEPLSCCVKNVRRANLLANDFVVIVGMGSIGLMMLQLLKLIPTQVLAIDLKPERLNLAQNLGADHILLGNNSAVQDAIFQHTEGRGADLIVFTAGNEQVFQKSIDWVRDGGALNLFASLSETPVPLNLDRLYQHEINLFSSYSPSPQDLKEANQLLVERKVNMNPLVTHHLDLEDIEQGFELINRQEALKVIIHP